MNIYYQDIIERKMCIRDRYTAIREMRKHVCWYTAGYPHSARLRERINEMETMQELEAVIRG